MDFKIKSLINELIRKVEIKKVADEDSVIYIGPGYFPDYSNCSDSLNKLREILEAKFLNVHKNNCLLKPRGYFFGPGENRRFLVQKHHPVVGIFQGGLVGQVIRD